MFVSCFANDVIVADPSSCSRCGDLVGPQPLKRHTSIAVILLCERIHPSYSLHNQTPIPSACTVLSLLSSRKRRILSTGPITTTHNVTYVLNALGRWCWRVLHIPRQMIKGSLRPPTRLHTLREGIADCKPAYRLMSRENVLLRRTQVSYRARTQPIVQDKHTAIHCLQWFSNRKSS